MPLKVTQYRNLARNCRNLAELACDEKSKAAMLDMANDYDRKADIREQSLAAVRAAAPSPVPPPEVLAPVTGNHG
jgi:hypothetical protein